MLLVPPPPPAPLTPELHASSSPPPPTAAAPAPIARSRPRRFMPPPGLMLPGSTVWSLISHRSPCEVVLQRGTVHGNRAEASPCTRERLVTWQMLGGHPFASDIPLPSPRRQRQSQRREAGATSGPKAHAS